MIAKNTFFQVKETLNCCGKLVHLDHPLVMGILNLTPDSFFDGGRYNDESTVLNRVNQMIDEGADIVDVGGVSTRPGAPDVSEEEELRRVIKIIALLSKTFPQLLISVDTFRAKVAEEAVGAGARMINDISAGVFDENLMNVSARLHCPYVLTHMQGTPDRMQQNPVYDNVAQEVITFLMGKIKVLKQRGVTDIVVDPGFGFGKNTDHNFDLLRHLRDFKILGLPIMVGISRKSMVNKVLKTKPETALNGSTVLNTFALLNGASILRVHDVREAKEAILLTSEFLDVG